MPWALLALLLMSAAAPPPPPPAAADLILHNGIIHTVDPSRPLAHAVAARGGRFVAVGEDGDVMALRGPSTRVIDLRGKTVVPGLIDAHGHVSSLGFALDRLRLEGTTSAAEVAGMVRDKAASAEPGRWILGRGWDQNDWEIEKFPTHAPLDEAAPRHPVALTRVDGHALWVNAKALELAGVTATTPDPPGGRIVRDASGEATGVLIDAAKDLITAAIPPPDRRQTREALERSMRSCLRAGLTGVHDAGVSAMELEIYREMLVDGGFPFRVYAMLTHDDALLDAAFARGPETGLGDGRLTVRAVKFYADGALGSRGAALLEPYTDDPGNTGLMQIDPKELTAAIRRASQHGFQSCVHAIGDNGNKVTLDAMRDAMDEEQRGRLRPRIEHAQILAVADIPRFASLGVLASMQPTHATSDMPWAVDRLGRPRLEGAYAWRSLREAGARLACGSDFPVESERPLLGFYAAVTRQDAAGGPEGGWMPRQRMTREEALRCFTLDAAWAGFDEDLRGSITVGKLADLTVLSDDIMTVPVARIPGTGVVMTIVGGRVAFE